MLFRKANIRIKGITKEKREKGVDSLFKEIVAENIPNLGKNLHIKVHEGGFPGGAVVENLPANAGNTGSSPGLGRSHMPRSN